MKRYAFTSLLLLVIILSIVLTTAQASSDIPSRIDVDYHVSRGFGWDSQSKLTFKSDGWSTKSSRNGALIPDMILLGKVDFNEYFGHIDFGQFQTWDVVDNESNFVYDASIYELNVIIRVNSKELDFDFKGQGYDLVCNIQDACNFVDTILNIIFHFDNSTIVYFPHPASFWGLIFVFLAFYIPYKNQQKIKKRSQEKGFIVTEVFSLYISYFIIYGIVSTVSPLDSFSSYFFPLILSHLTVYLLFRWYYTKMWFGPQEIDDNGSAMWPDNTNHEVIE